MQPGALRALEFDRIVEAVRSFAVTPMGDDRLAQIAPSSNPETVARLLAGTTETTNFLATGGTFALRASSDLPEILSALAVEGRALESLRLLALATFLESIDESCAAIRRAPNALPILEAAIGGAASFSGEIAQVREKIDFSGEVLDSASPQLKAIRERLRKQKSRLRNTLESYLRGKETAKYLQDQVVTERNGRYVIVVKSEHRTSIPGIVHGASTSGASLFLEPLSTVEINNDIVALEEQEAEEVRRILLALTDAFRARSVDLQQTIEAGTSVDVLQARARFSNSIDGIEPALSTDGAFELQAARHPLIREENASGTSKLSAVPVTIKIIPPATVLLVTGPNTGGKTVALKTAGLLSLMAQSGLRIPAADGSRLPVFRTVFADIGDEQSIDANLSTFSGHITNIASMDRALQVPALVLLDEIGSGTDPIEGGALGVAVVDHFRKRGATVMATSHYDALKTYASTTAGVASAAFGFNTDTFAPTYQLLYGSPGRSLALEIAGAPRPRSFDHPGSPGEPDGARSAACRAPCENRPRHARARARAAPRRARAGNTRSRRSADAPARRYPAAAGRDVPPPVERRDRHPSAQGAAGNRRGDRGVEGADRSNGADGRQQPVSTGEVRSRAQRRTPAPSTRSPAEFSSPSSAEAQRACVSTDATVARASATGLSSAAWASKRVVHVGARRHRRSRRPRQADAGQRSRPAADRRADGARCAACV